MEDFVKNVIEGKVSDEQLKDFREKLSTEGQGELDKAIAFTRKRQDEEGKLKETTDKVTAEEARLTKVREDAKAEEDRAAGIRATTDKVRKDAQDSTKVKFFEDYKIPPEKQAEYEAAFKDSTTVDQAEIYENLQKVHVAVNAPEYLKLEQDRIAREKAAAEMNGSGAGSHKAPPPGNDPPKFTPEVQKMATESNITPEAAKRIAEEGYGRNLE